MRFLVTGSSGFIGSAVVNELGNIGHDVCGVDLIPSPTTDWVGDIRDWIRLNHNTVVDHVLHFAGIVGGRIGIEHNYFNIMDNISIDTAVSNWSVKNTYHLLYPSSSAVYPIAAQGIDGNLLVENMVDMGDAELGMPDHLYGWSKMTAERLLHEMGRSGPRITILRPFSGYGPSQSMDYPFPSLVGRVMDSKDGMIDVWGNGKQVRDFVHIDDIVSSVIHHCSVDADTTINVSTGVGTSMSELILLIAEVCGKEIHTINPLLDKPTGVMYRVGDTTKQIDRGIGAAISLRSGIVDMIQ